MTPHRVATDRTGLADVARTQGARGGFNSWLFQTGLPDGARSVFEPPCCNPGAARSAGIKPREPMRFEPRPVADA